MKLIRNSVWETNSSSCHSISLASSDKEFVLDTIYPDNNGIIYIKTAYFGRWFERSNDVNIKASYAATSIQYGLDEQLLIDIIKEQTGAIDVIIEGDGDIDHESVAVCPRNKEDLRNFIFNKNSWLFIAHDEGTPELGFYDVLPIYTKDGVIEPDFKYELNIPFINKSFKLLELPNEKQFYELIESLDVRYNKTKNLWEVDSNYWKSTEKYFEPKYYLEQKLENGYILLFDSDKMDNIRYHKWRNLTYEEREERQETFLKARCNFKYFIKLPFTITKL